MVVVMTGSPNAGAYPAPSAEVWARRAQQEASKSTERTKGFEELRQQVTDKKAKLAAEKREKKRLEDARFKARQKAVQDAKAAERTQRSAQRAAALQKISQEHEGWVHKERELEKKKISQGQTRTADMADGLHQEDEIEAALLSNENEMKTAAWESLAEQRRLDEENEALRAATEKADREAKANALREQVKRQKDEEERAARELAYKIKKDMELETRKQREVEANKAAEQRQRAMAERKKNDEYDAWLAKDHIRTAAERAHERTDPSKMHQGGIPGHGKPTDFTPGR